MVLIMSIDWSEIVGLVGGAIGLAAVLGSALLWLIMPRIEKKIEDVSVKAIRETVNGKVDVIGVKMDTMTKQIGMLVDNIAALNRSGDLRSKQILGVQEHVDRLTESIVEEIVK